MTRAYRDAETGVGNTPLSTLGQPGTTKVDT